MEKLQLSMIMHVFKEKGIKFDFVVGAKVDGFDDQVKLSDNDLIIIEGDEYLSSKIDNKPSGLQTTLFSFVRYFMGSY